MKRINDINSKIKTPTLKKKVPLSEETIFQQKLNTLLPNNRHNVENPSAYLTQKRSESKTKKNNFEQLMNSQEFLNLRKKIYKGLKEDTNFNLLYPYETSLSNLKNYTNDFFGKAIKYSGLKAEDFLQNPKNYLYINEILGEINMSSGGKVGVHFGLYCTTIEKLGTNKHLDLLKRGLGLKDLGCFMMTEVGHGSNVQGILTTAHYLHSERSFILNTPHELGMKFWIGNLARTANYGVVFANLIVGEHNHGVHVFFIKIRDDKGNVLPGIVLGDCGPKLGMNGIDNGWVIFNSVQLPYFNLLDKYSQVNEQGEFVSSIKKKTQRFALQLAALSGGRILVANTSTKVMMNMLGLALRYLTVRKQFGDKSYQENQVINYPSVQKKMFPFWSRAIINNIFVDKIHKDWQNSNNNPTSEKTLKEIHALCSYVKTRCTYDSLQTLYNVRELCGGHGYSSYSLIGNIINSQNVQITWEGTNDILIQQTAKFLLDIFSKYISKGEINYESLLFLKDFENEDRIDNELKQIKLFFNDLDYKNYDILILCKYLKRLGQLKFKNMMETCIERFSLSLDKDMNLFKAFNKSLPFALRETSIFYGDLMALDNFENFVNNINNDFIHEKNFYIKNMAIFYLDSIKTEGQYLVEEMNLKFFQTVDNILVNIYPTLISDYIVFADSTQIPDVFFRSTLGDSNGQPYKNIITRIYADEENFGKRNWESIMKLRKMM